MKARDINELGVQAHSLGCFGCDVYADTDTHTGNWFGMYVVADVTINAITDTVDTGVTASTVPTATAIAAGAYIPAAGKFTSIDLTSGTVVMYRLSS